MKMLIDGTPGIGTKRHSLRDFYENCEKEGVRVIESNEKFSFYFCVGNDHFIVLPTRLSGVSLLFAALHEWAHYARSPGEIALFGGESTRDEMQADAIALVAMMPNCELLDDTPEAYELWRQRMDLKNRYGV